LGIEPFDIVKLAASRLLRISDILKTRKATRLVAFFKKNSKVRSLLHLLHYVTIELTFEKFLEGEKQQGSWCKFSKVSSIGMGYRK